MSQRVGYPWPGLFCSLQDIVGPEPAALSGLRLPANVLRPDFGGHGTRAGEDAGTCRNFEGGKLWRQACPAMPGRNRPPR